MEVHYFKTLKGEEPVSDYLTRLPMDDAAGIRALISLLSEKKALTPPEAEKVEGEKNLWGMRHKKHWIFYAYLGNVAVLMHSYKKHSEEISKEELEIAIERLKLLEKK